MRLHAYSRQSQIWLRFKFKHLDSLTLITDVPIAATISIALKIHATYLNIGALSVALRAVLTLACESHQCREFCHPLGILEGEVPVAGPCFKIVNFLSILCQFSSEVSMRAVEASVEIYGISAIIQEVLEGSLLALCVFLFFFYTFLRDLIKDISVSPSLLFVTNDA